MSGKRTALDSLTAVQWGWRADDKWILYDAKKNLEIENEYRNGTKRIKVDDERFVDVGLTKAHIKKNLYCLDCEEKTSIGLQRRYDDESKRRAVQRVAPDFFKGVIFVVWLSDDDEAALVENVLESYGGSIRPGVTKRTKVIIAGSDQYDNNKDDWDKAETLDIPIVDSEWIAECVRQKAWVDPANSEWVVEKPSAGTKRKTPEPDEDEMDVDVASKTSVVAPPPAKKQKTSDVVAPVAPAASSSSSAAAIALAPAPKSAASLVAPRTPTALFSQVSHWLAAHFQRFHGSDDSIKQKTTWMGVCSYDGENFPFTLTIQTVSGNNITGTVDWPTLNNAKTKFKGTVSGSNVEFTEYECIRGEDDVALPAEYKGTISSDDSGSSIAGTVNELAADGVSGKFTVTFVESDEAEEAAEPAPLIAGVLEQNKKYTGVITQTHPFELKVSSRTGDKIEGTITWTELKCTTKFRGAIDPATEELTIEEYELVNVAPGGQEPELPMHYSAAVASDLDHMIGSWGSDLSKPEGKFKLKLSL